MNLELSRLTINGFSTDGFCLSKASDQHVDVVFVANRTSLPGVVTQSTLIPSRLYITHLDGNKRFWGLIPALPCAADSVAMLLSPVVRISERKERVADLDLKVQLTNYVRDTKFTFPKLSITPSSHWTGFDIKDEFDKEYSVFRFGGKRVTSVLNLVQAQAVLMEETHPLDHNLLEQAQGLLEMYQQSSLIDSGLLYTTRGFAYYGP